MSDVLFGYAAALTPINLIAAVISVAIGITIGALPGLSAAMGVALCREIGRASCRERV